MSKKKHPLTRAERRAESIRAQKFMNRLQSHRLVSDEEIERLEKVDPGPSILGKDIKRKRKKR